MTSLNLGLNRRIPGLGFKEKDRLECGCTGKCVTPAAVRSAQQWIARSFPSAYRAMIRQKARK